MSSVTISDGAWRSKILRKMEFDGLFSVASSGQFSLENASRAAVKVTVGLFHLYQSLGKFNRWQLDHIFFSYFYPEKVLAFQTNCLLRRQFAGNAKTIRQVTTTKHSSPDIPKERKMRKYKDNTNATHETTDAQRKRELQQRNRLGKLMGWKRWGWG